MKQLSVICLRNPKLNGGSITEIDMAKTTIRPVCEVTLQVVAFGKGKGVTLQAWAGPEGSWKLRLSDYVTTAQDGGRLSALGTGRLYPRKCSWNSFLLDAESTQGP